MSPLANLFLAVIGGPTVFGSVLLLCRQLAYRHARIHGPDHARAGRAMVHVAEQEYLAAREQRAGVVR